MIAFWILVLATMAFSLSAVHQDWREAQHELFWESLSPSLEDCEAYVWRIDWPVDFAFIIDSTLPPGIILEIDEYYVDLYIGKLWFSLRIKK